MHKFLSFLFSYSWLFLFLSFLSLSDAFKWPLDGKSHRLVLSLEEEYSNYPSSIRVSEGFLFSSSQGPSILPDGTSFVSVSNNLKIYLQKKDTMPKPRIVMTIIGSRSTLDASLPDLCTINPLETQRLPSSIISFNLTETTGDFSECSIFSESSLSLNGLYCLYTGSFSEKILVNEPGNYDVVYSLCLGERNLEKDQFDRYLDGLAGDKMEKMQSGQRQLSCMSSSSTYTKYLQSFFSSFSFSNTLLSLPPTSFSSYNIKSPEILAIIEGEITFQNPYGYLPGEMYGFLPYYFTRLILYAILFFIFIFLLINNKKNILLIHKLLFTLLLISLVESALWASSMESINSTGEPYCCPHPSFISASLIFQIFRETLTRNILLILCLGYGIARPNLLLIEWIFGCLLTSLYFVFSLINESLLIVSVSDENSKENGNQINKNYDRVSKVFLFIQFILDVLILSWAYFSIKSTIRILDTHRQYIKLNIYKRLINVLFLIITIFISFSLLFLLLEKFNINNIESSSYHPIDWIPQSIWDLLNFFVIVTFCFVCRPSLSSGILAYSTQIPADEDIEMILGPNSLADDDFDEFLDDNSNNGYIERSVGFKSLSDDRLNNNWMNSSNSSISTSPLSFSDINPLHKTKNSK